MFQSIRRSARRRRIGVRGTVVAAVWFLSAACGSTSGETSPTAAGPTTSAVTQPAVPSSVAATEPVAAGEQEAVGSRSGMPGRWQPRGRRPVRTRHR